jgi:hypothetical protein
MLPPRNTSRPSAPHRTAHSACHALTLVLGRGEASERARVCGTPVTFIQLHKRCTERLPNKLDGRLLQYPYDISLFPLALNTWTFNSFIITINGPRPIYLTPPSLAITELLRAPCANHRPVASPPSPPAYKRPGRHSPPHHGAPRPPPSPSQSSQHRRPLDTIAAARRSPSISLSGQSPPEVSKGIGRPRAPLSIRPLPDRRRAPQPRCRRRSGPSSAPLLLSSVLVKGQREGGFAQNPLLYFFLPAAPSLLSLSTRAP